ncbi:MAG: hypothetical protein ACRC5C_13210 [Bacilli bacterium]
MSSSFKIDRPISKTFYSFGTRISFFNFLLEQLIEMDYDVWINQFGEADHIIRDVLAKHFDEESIDGQPLLELILKHPKLYAELYKLRWHGPTKFPAIVYFYYEPGECFIYDWQECSFISSL